MRYFRYDEPEGGRTVSESDIMFEFWFEWCSKMTDQGRERHISREGCITDWCAIHWAVEVRDGRD